MRIHFFTGCSSVFLFFYLLLYPCFSEKLSPSHFEIAQKTLSLLRITDVYDTVFPAAAAALKHELIQQWPDKQALIVKIVNQQVLSLLSRRLDLEKKAAAIYARAFSESELHNIHAFYTSESGKKFMKKTPVVVQELIDTAQVWKKDVARDLAYFVQKELTKSSSPLSDSN